MKQEIIVNGKKFLLIQSDFDKVDIYLIQTENEKQKRYNITPKRDKNHYKPFKSIDLAISYIKKY